MLLLSRVPFIQEKHALEKSFAPIDPFYSYPEYEGKIFHIYSVLHELFSPTSVLEQAGSFGSKLPSKNLQMFWFSVMLGPDSFDSMSFQISKLLCLPPECLVYGELRFQNILNRKLMNIFISVPKTVDSSDHAHLDRNKQDFIQLTKQFGVFR